MRPKEEHLMPGEIDLALRGADREQPQLREHLDRCSACSLLLLALKNYAQQPASGSAYGANICPPEEVWLDIAEGKSDEEHSAFLEHAAACAICSLALREALELVGETSGPLLESSTEEWQSRMGRRLHQLYSETSETEQTSADQVPAPVVLQWKGRGWTRARWFPALAACLLLTLAGGGSAIWWQSRNSDAALLARAYDQRRTLALRIPGGQPGPLVFGNRGSGDESGDAPELIRFEARARTHLADNPDDPYWQQMLGEYFLLKPDGKLALRSLNASRQGNANLPHLQEDIAAALFELADQTSEKANYAKAAEIYSELLADPKLKREPFHAAELYFNRALCWERQGLRANALDDLKQSLALEPTEAWRRTIRGEIARISATITAAPASDDYETGLEKATRGLLPQWQRSFQARAHIEATAISGLKHHDNWLMKWSSGPHTSLSDAADQHLSSAVTAAARGDAHLSLIESRLAETAYRGVGSMPGFLRASLAESYALQRLGSSHECLALVNQLLKVPELLQFSWLHARAVLERAECEESAGDYRKEIEALEEASVLSKRDNLPLLTMRIAMLEVELQSHEGRYQTLWQMDIQALRECERVLCPPSTQFSLMYLLAQAAKSLDLPHVAAEITRSATLVAEKTGNRATYAYSLEFLGTLLGGVGDFPGSAIAFDHAFLLAEQNKLPAIYVADWRIDQAAVLGQQNRPKDAGRLLEQASPMVLGSTYSPIRIRYWRQLAETQGALRETEHAIRSGWNAVREAEKILPSIQGPLDRTEWQKANAESYAALIRTYVQVGDDAAALQTWERFRSAPYGYALDAASAPQIPASVRRSPILVLARVGSNYIGWLTSSETMAPGKTRNLGLAKDIETLATNYYEMCEDRKSPLRDVARIGSQLYLALIAPFQPEISESPEIWLDVDDKLSVVPFEALVLGDGRWWGEQTDLVMLPKWWTLRADSSLATQTVSHSALVVAVNGFGDTQNEGSETNAVREFFPKTRVFRAADLDQEGMRTIRGAEVFHFSGHAQSEANRTGLLLGSGMITPDLLASARFEHCSLGVLAACNTNASDPDRIEAVPDLRNALMEAGVRNVVASNWDVDDGSTRALMTVFYRNLAKGATPIKALSMARNEVRSQSQWSHPFYWAPFEIFTN